MDSSDYNQSLYEYGFRGMEKEMDEIAKNNVDWNFALYGVCAGGWAFMIENIMAKGANNVNAALCFACKHGQIECATIMIKKGATDFFAGFANCCIRDSFKVAKLLLREQLNHYDCLTVAIKLEAVRIIPDVLERKRPRQWILLACQKQDWHMLSFLSLYFIKN